MVVFASLALLPPTLLIYITGYNNQSKAVEMSEKDSALNSASQPVADGEPAKRKPGRPKSSPHDAATQKRVNMQRHRAAKRDENEVRVEVYLPKVWHDRLLSEGANLREVGLEAFALWFEKRDLPTGKGDGSTPKKAA